MGSFRPVGMRLSALVLLAGAAAFAPPARPAVGARPSRLVRASPLRLQLAGSYTVRLPKPLGIVFEEVAPGEAQGVLVAGLVEGGNAENDGRVLVGDKLLRASAVSFAGQSALVTLGAGQQFTSFERQLIPCTALDFETIMAAIGSNEGRYGYTDVVLSLAHTDASIPRPNAPRADRLTGQDVQWDAAAGTTSNGRSTPLRPKADNFDVDV